MREWATNVPGRRILIALISGFLAAGCFSYAPVETSPAAERNLERGTPVRVILVEPIEVELDDIAVRRAREVRGEFVTWEAGGSRGERNLVLSVMGVESVNGTTRSAPGITIRVPERSIGAFQEKKFSLGKSALIAIPVGLAAALLPSALDPGPAEGGSGGGPPTTQ